MPVERKYKHTKLCVLCMKKKAHSWSGHVRDGKHVILAGWCKKCEDAEIGFVGHYKKKMKTIED